MSTPKIARYWLMTSVLYDKSPNSLVGYGIIISTRLRNNFWLGRGWVARHIWLLIQPPSTDPIGPCYYYQHVLLRTERNCSFIDNFRETPYYFPRTENFQGTSQLLPSILVWAFFRSKSVNWKCWFICFLFSRCFEWWRPILQQSDGGQ